jgi:hypothetical protein
MRPDTVSTIVDSLVERRDEWVFKDDDLTCRFIYHKSGFALYAFSNIKVEVWIPKRAKSIIFSSEEMKLIYSAVESIRTERLNRLQDKIKASVVDMLMPIEQRATRPVWWRRIFNGSR